MSGCGGVVTCLGVGVWGCGDMSGLQPERSVNVCGWVRVRRCAA